MVLFDCGASHNLISRELIAKSGLQQEATLPHVVEVGDRHNVHFQGKCRVYFGITRPANSTRTFCFHLQGADIILGLEWLATLGEVRADFGRSHTIEIRIFLEKYVA